MKKELNLRKIMDLFFYKFLPKPHIKLKMLLRKMQKLYCKKFKRELLTQRNK